ncbi:class I SAM-dependent methyltransferase [Roseobacter sp. HKCCA0434]|uniref:class I SAM-dependent methyltransferase n=1 Tax=Roseobacter sp. HKCCA0434 TaxID=3079297 RepID=UPI003966DA59
MLRHAAAALALRGARAQIRAGGLEEAGPARFDCVLAAHVIEHFADPLGALTRMRDLLRAGGRLYLVVSRPHWCNVLIWLRWRHRTFGEGEITGLVARAGLDVTALHRFTSGPPSRTSIGIVADRPHRTGRGGR